MLNAMKDKLREAVRNLTLQIQVCIEVPFEYL